MNLKRYQFENLKMSARATDYSLRTSFGAAQDNEFRKSAISDLCFDF